MFINSFKILLDNPSMTYIPGQIVSGKVVIKTTREISTKSVGLKFEGKASVKLYNYRAMSTEIASSEEIFFDISTFLHRNGHDDVIICPGDSSYPFSFRLNLALPSSFEGAHGKVEYTLSANVQRSWWSDYKTKQRIFIQPILNLNQYPEAREAASWMKSKTFGFLWWKSAPLTMYINLIKIGYCPGEILSLEVRVNNSSRKVINNLSMKLIQTVEYRSGRNSKHNTTTLLTVKRGKGVRAAETDIWIPEVEIPNVVPTNLGGCRIIGVSYAVTVTAHVSGAALNLSYDCPIIIGTEPLRV